MRIGDRNIARPRRTPDKDIAAARTVFRLTESHLEGDAIGREFQWVPRPPDAPSVNEIEN